MSRVPKAVVSGSRAHIIAPSGPVPIERLEQGVKLLRRHLGLDLIHADNLLEQHGYLAGTDAQRLRATQSALADPNAAAVFCARGGYGATRLLGALDPERLHDHPKLLVGFSDITALLGWAWMRAGVVSIHGPVLTQLSTLAREDLDRLFDLLRGDVPPPLTAEEGTVLHGGTVEGTMIAGNLEVLRSLVGTRFMPSLSGAILAIEEVGERAYRIDRTLTQLLSSGALRGVRGVIVGQLHNCDPPGDAQLGPTALEVVIERLTTLGVPAVTGFPFGHGESRNAALPFGGRVRLHADECTLEILEPIAR